MTPEDRAWYDRGREAFARGDLHAAKRIFLRLVAAYAKHPAFVSELTATQDALEAASSETRGSMLRAAPDVVPLLTESFRSAKPATLPPRRVPRLKLLRSKPNKITDEEEWFGRVGPLAESALPPADSFFVVQIDLKDAATDQMLARLLGTGWIVSTPSPRYRQEAFPAWIPPAYGTAPLGRLIHSPPFTLGLYDRYLAVFDADRRVVRVLDLVLMYHPESHKKRPDIKVGTMTLSKGGEAMASGDLVVKDLGPRHDFHWAQARDGVLYISTAFNGYAKEVRGQTSTITAIDLKSGDILFRSDPLTSNSHDFVFWEGAILTGYGFSAEPDFVYVLDASTGRTVQKVPVTTSPEALIAVPDKSQVEVRGYDRDMTFLVQ